MFQPAPITNLAEPCDGLYVLIVISEKAGGAPWKRRKNIAKTLPSVARSRNGLLMSMSANRSCKWQRFGTHAQSSWRSWQGTTESPESSLLSFLLTIFARRCSEDLVAKSGDKSHTNHRTRTVTAHSPTTVIQATPLKLSKIRLVRVREGRSVILEIEAVVLGAGDFHPIAVEPPVGHHCRPRHGEGDWIGHGELNL